MSRAPGTYRAARREAAKTVAKVSRTKFRDEWPGYRNKTRTVREQPIRSGKYTGERLRAIRAEKGCGRPPRESARR